MFGRKTQKTQLDSAILNQARAEIKKNGGILTAASIMMVYNQIMSRKAIAANDAKHGGRWAS